MKIVLALMNVTFFRHHDGIVRCLCDKGHEVDIVVNEILPPGRYDRALLACVAETNGARYEAMIQPRNRGWYWLLSRIRETLNYCFYFTPGHPSPQRHQRWVRHLPRPLRRLSERRLVRGVLISRASQMLMRWIQSVIPVDPAIGRWLSVHQPDVVVASPFVYQHAVEKEYIRAAKSLKIPTVVSVASWDNLTTKGTFHVVPDTVLVWNDVMCEEAAVLHGLPRQTILATGAPPFDTWFEAQPISERTSFCREAGLDPAQPFIVYACSSGSIAGDEVSFVEQFAKSIRSHRGLQELGLLVRPHPMHATIWKTFQHPAIRVWPQHADIPDSPEARLSYYSTLYHSAAVAGVNTSAFLDAACIDRPCVTLLSERYKGSQLELGHFRHLIDADFLEVADDGADAASIIARILSGDDAKVEQRRWFVMSFMRPHGMKSTASEIAASAIEQTALGKPAREILAAIGADDRPRHSSAPMPA